MRASRAERVGLGRVAQCFGFHGAQISFLTAPSLAKNLKEGQTLNIQLKLLELAHRYLH